MNRLFNIAAREGRFDEITELDSNKNYDRLFSFAIDNNLFNLKMEKLLARKRQEAADWIFANYEFEDMVEDSRPWRETTAGLSKIVYLEPDYEELDYPLGESPTYRVIFYVDFEDEHSVSAADYDTILLES